MNLYDQELIFHGANSGPPWLVVLRVALLSSIRWSARLSVMDVYLSPSWWVYLLCGNVFITI